jgi:predicted nucleic acid-binding protein
MSPVVVDTDVASYIFKWHPSGQRYLDVMRGSELILSFMSVAEMRMGAISAGWGIRRRELLEQFIASFRVVYADDALCTSWAHFAPVQGRRVDRSVPRTHGSRPRRSA